MKGFGSVECGLIFVILILSYFRTKLQGKNPFDIKNYMDTMLLISGIIVIDIIMYFIKK